MLLVCQGCECLTNKEKYLPSFVNIFKGSGYCCLVFHLFLDDSYHTAFGMCGTQQENLRHFGFLLLPMDQGSRTLTLSDR